MIRLVERECFPVGFFFVGGRYMRERDWRFLFRDAW